MHVIPRYVAGLAVDPEGAYKCPLCRTQRAGDEADTGWVSCPMVEDQMVCLGSCIDYQAVARSEVFLDHPDRDLYDELARRVGAKIEVLRSVCLRHQVSVIDERIRQGDIDAEGLKKIRESIQSRLVDIQGEDAIGARS